MPTIPVEFLNELSVAVGNDASIRSESHKGVTEIDRVLELSGVEQKDSGGFAGISGGGDYLVPCGDVVGMAVLLRDSHADRHVHGAKKQDVHPIHSGDLIDDFTLSAL